MEIDFEKQILKNKLDLIELHLLSFMQKSQEIMKNDLMSGGRPDPAAMIALATEGNCFAVNIISTLDPDKSNCMYAHERYVRQKTDDILKKMKGKKDGR